MNHQQKTIILSHKTYRILQYARIKQLFIDCQEERTKLVEKLALLKVADLQTIFKDSNVFELKTVIKDQNYFDLLSSTDCEDLEQENRAELVGIIDVINEFFSQVPTLQKKWSSLTYESEIEDFEHVLAADTAFETLLKIKMFYDYLYPEGE